MSLPLGDISMDTEVSEVDNQPNLSGPTSPLQLDIAGNITHRRIMDIGVALTINFVATAPVLGDEVKLVVEGAASSPGTITWGSNTITASGETTLATVANKKKLAFFYYDGEGWFLYRTVAQA